ncbi:MAG: type 2 isopentenyl-diphosphate Delta-isomerase [Polyangiaceae bacterium]|nr:type 2 isopentenyl-diphosphate Delta-isomerase [Polyangiaceae bacterium]
MTEAQLQIVDSPKAAPAEHDIQQRKADHIDLCATGDVGFRAKTNLFDDVDLVHDALPELHVDEVDTSVTLFGKKLSAPIVIAAMTGGTEKARAINLELAKIADEEGYGFGLGSQRAMLDASAGRDPTYDVRKVAPKVLLLGNIGAVQARQSGLAALEDLVGRVQADALCIHLNPAMEIVQPGGDKDFTGIVDFLGEAADELSVPAIAKETGCGIGPRAAHKIASAGIRHLDVSGAGGTSWVAVEMQRARGDEKHLGTVLRDWGVPTAASVVIAAATRPRFNTIIATGGVSGGVDIAKAIALGAHAGGIARPVLQALTEGGPEGARAFLSRVRQEIKACMLLVGARNVSEMRSAPLIVGERLERWQRLAAEGVGRKKRRKKA